MHGTGSPRAAAAVIWWGVLAALVVTVLLAPILTVGWCADAPHADASMCHSAQRSLVGIESSLALWLVALAVVIAVTAAAARRRRAPRD